MKIKITADSTADLSKELIEKYDISLLPLTVNLGEDEYLDGVNVTNDQIYDYVTKTGLLPKTGAISPEGYKTFFSSFLNNGYDGVIHFSLSSLMSSSNENAIKASEELNNVRVVNSLSLSTGTGLLCIYASELTKKDLSLDDIYEKCNSRAPYIQASFIVDNLKFLYKGGRCSALALLGANLLRLKPCIEVKSGKMGVEKKYRGNIAKCFEQYVNDILEKYNNPDKTRCFITYTTFEDEAVQKMKEFLEKQGFKEVLITKAGSTVTSHCGKNTIGILYINDQK